MSRTSKMFPVRMLGFSFFWAWLFLVAVSPSPLFGRLLGPGETPFELWENGFRSLVLVGIVVCARKVATPQGKWALVACSSVAGIAGVVVLAMASAPECVVFASALVGIADSCMFVAWLCFFGYLRLGETALLIALSYAVGSLMLFLVRAVGPDAMLVASVALPLASGLSFVLANRSFAGQNDGSLFAPGATPAPLRRRMPSAVARLFAALFGFSTLFALYSCTMAAHAVDNASGPLVQGLCSIFVALVIGIMLLVFRRPKGIYALYRLIPLAIGSGYCLFGVSGTPAWTIAGVLVMSGFLTFEMLAFNDFCNVVRANDSLLVLTMGMARLVSSVGMFVGWAAGCVAANVQLPGGPIDGVAFAGVLGVLAVSSLVFSRVEEAGLRDLSDDRAALEKIEELNQRESLIEGFSDAHGLSGRESEVLGYLLSGRNAVYIAEKLYIAESTARTHIHKIYQKTDTHARMDLLDSFDAYCRSQGVEGLSSGER